MTTTRGPASLADLIPATVAEMGRRAARDDFDRWAAQAQGCGHCSRPIRLKGSTTTRTPDGRLIDGYDTRQEPDGVAYVRCGNRRANVCPSCSHEYQGDMWHLLYAGTAGGIKDVPDTVATHPLDFVTLTAPSFGPVHTTRGPGGPATPAADSPRSARTGGPSTAPGSTTTTTPTSAPRSALTATTTPGRSRSTGTPPNCGAASPSPSAAASPTGSASPAPSYAST